MSGIAGVMVLDGTNPTASQIEVLSKRLERRGPDGTHVLIQGQVALGHTLLATTPEALVEVLPLTDGPSGCAITADARLDNRDELMRALGLAEETRVIGDGELILRAYLEWGEQCPTKLLGDFAFAIWDPRSSSLLCARDQIGMRQLTYHYDAQCQFVFATEPAAIVGHPAVDVTLNQERIGDYLSNMEGADLSSTFFQDIHRLPPAHILKVDGGGLEVRRYWELEPEPILKLASDEAYAEAFVALFTEAVRCRLRSPGSIGAMVSGGIDSNAVAAVAAELQTKASLGPLPTFSATGLNALDCVETRAIMTALRSSKFAPTTINYGSLDAFRSELLREAIELAEPFDADMSLIRAVYLAARQAGVNTVLDGVQSDMLLASNFHTAFLLREGKFLQSLREVKGSQQFWGPQFSAWRAFIAASWQAFAPTSIKGMRFRWGRRKADRRFVAMAKEVFPALDLTYAIARRQGVQRRDFENDGVDAFTRMRVLTHPNVVVVRERYDRVAGSFGIEPRDPFLDLRLVRFCLSLPRDQLQRNGWPKWILRQAMARMVPPEIRWRHGKAHLGPEFTQAILGGQGRFGKGKSRKTAATERSERNRAIFLSNWFAYVDKMNEDDRVTEKGKVR